MEADQVGPKVGEDVTALMGAATPKIGEDVTHLMTASQPDFKATNEPPSASLWEQANTPLVPQIAKASHAISDFLSTPRLGESELNDHLKGLGTLSAMIRGGGAGMVEGAGNVLSAFTSPIGIALTLAGQGEDSALVKAIPGLKSLVSLPAVKALQATVKTGAGAAFAAHGANQVVTAPTLAQKAQGAVEAATGALGMASGAPELAGTLTASLGDMAAARQQARLGKISGQQTSDLLKAVPPTKSSPYNPGDLARVRPYLEAEHDVSPISTVEELRDAADSSITQIEEHVAKAIAANPTDIIRTNPLAAVRRQLGGNPRASFLQDGLKELSDLPLDQPLNLADADAIRLQLNYENKGILKKNNYDTETARRVDPGFAAREAAANELRDGIYQQLQARGVQGISGLRQDEGSLLKVRNAAQNQIFSGDKTVAGTGDTSLARKIAARTVMVGSSAGGAALAGPAGAASGALIGQELGATVNRPNLTRDGLVARAFKQATTNGPQYPAIPPASPVRGLLGQGPIVTPPPADTSFVRAVPADLAQRNVRGLLGPGATQLGAGADTSGGGTVPARGIVIRDPRTGRFRRVYTAEAAPATTRQ